MSKSEAVRQDPSFVDVERFDPEEARVLTALCELKVKRGFSAVLRVMSTFLGLPLSNVREVERGSEEHISEVRNPEEFQKEQRERHLYDSKRKRLESALRTLKRSNPSFPKMEEEIREKISGLEGEEGEGKD